jgi:hypothetical protein
MEKGNTGTCILLIGLSSPLLWDPFMLCAVCRVEGSCYVLSVGLKDNLSFHFQFLLLNFVEDLIRVEKHEIQHIGYQNFQSGYWGKSMDEASSEIFLFTCTVTGLETFRRPENTKIFSSYKCPRIKQLIPKTLEEHMKERDQIQA